MARRRALMMRGERRVADTGPASTGQEEIWISCGLAPDAPLFAVSIVLELEGRLNVPLLEQSISALVARHEVLRTTYRAGVDGLVQDVGGPWRVQIAFCDVSGLDAETARVVGAASHTDEARAPFDLRNGPIIRARLIKRRVGSYACLFTIHHIAIDGWSMGIFARELEAIHGAYHRGEQPALPELRLRYVDFARVQRERVAARTREHPLETIREKLRVPPLVFNAETSCPDAVYWDGEHVRLSFPQPLHARMAAFGREAKATRFAILTAVLWIVLYGHSRRTSFVMASDYANRSDPESGSLMGLFVTQLLLKATIDLTATFLEVVRQGQRELQQALNRAECPVSALLPNSADLKAAPPFRVKLVFEPPIDYPKLANLKVVAADVLSEWAKFDLLFTVRSDTDVTAWDLQYRKAMFNQSDMAAMLADVESLAQVALERPQSRVESLLGETAGLRERRAKRKWGALKQDLLSAVSTDAERAGHGGHGDGQLH